jgi:hypothetical protein
MQVRMPRTSSAVVDFAAVESHAPLNPAALMTASCSRCEHGTLVRAFGAAEPKQRPHVTLHVCDTCGWSFATVY